jgi:hypothetical protein
MLPIEDGYSKLRIYCNCWPPIPERSEVMALAKANIEGKY